MRMLRIWTGLLCSLPMQRAAAQQSSDGFPRWEGETTSAAEPRGDYRYEGLVFGGVALGAAGAWVGASISEACVLPAEPGTKCGSDRLGNAVVLGLAGAALGAGLGYLVGRFSTKRPPHSLLPATPSPSLVSIPDSVRRKVGYQHWKGAAIGSGVGAVLGMVAAFGLEGGCADCGWVTTGERLGTALIVTGIGGAAGLLAGLASPKYVWEHAPQ